MAEFEHKNTLKKYIELLKKIRFVNEHMHIKPKNMDSETIELVNSYIVDLDNFVDNYVKGRIKTLMSLSDINDNIDYDIRFLINNVNDEWKKEIIYLRDNLKRRAKFESSGFPLVGLLKINFITFFLFFIIIGFIGLRIYYEKDVSHDISTNEGILNAIDVHKKSRIYDSFIKKYEKIPPIVLSVIFWPIALNQKEEQYYSQFIKLNIETINMLYKKGLICNSFKNFENMNEYEADKFIKYLDVPSANVLTYIKMDKNTLSDKTYYAIIVKTYADNFPCK